MSATERPVSPEVREEFAIFRKKGLQVLQKNRPDLNFDSSLAPDVLVQILDSWIERWQERRRRAGSFETRTPESPTDEELAQWMGAVWGDQIIRRFGWEWVCLVVRSEEWFAVAAPDRSMVIFPEYYVRMRLQKPDLPTAIVMGYNILATGKIMPLPAPLSYRDVMHGLKQLVPKI